MQVNIVKLAQWRIPRQFILRWIQDLDKELKNLKNVPTELTIVFVESAHMKKLNHQFRGKNKVTDVLSFSEKEGNVGDELVLCGAKVEAQAREHGLQASEELGYLLIHGVLHLMGYDHEGDEKEAQRMFRLQDKIFEKLRNRHF